MARTITAFANIFFFSQLWLKFSPATRWWENSCRFPWRWSSSCWVRIPPLDFQIKRQMTMLLRLKPARHSSSDSLGGSWKGFRARLKFKIEVKVGPNQFKLKNLSFAENNCFQAKQLIMQWSSCYEADQISNNDLVWVFPEISRQWRFVR